VAVSKSQQKAVMRYDAKTYDKFLVRVKKGMKAEIEEVARKSPEKSLNGYVVKSIKQRIERDQANAATQTPETPEGDDLILRELGYDPLAKKALYTEKITGKHYFVEPVHNLGDDDEVLEEADLDW